MTDLLQAARDVLEVMPNVETEHPAFQNLQTAVQELQTAVNELSQEKTLQDLATERAQDLAGMVNTFSSETMAAYFVNEMARQHRTLQQNFTRLIIRWLEHLDKMGKEGNYDLRNEASCHFATKALEAAGDIRYLPPV